MGRVFLRVRAEGLPFATRTLRRVPRGTRLLFRYLFSEGPILTDLITQLPSTFVKLSTRLENVFTPVWLTRDY